MTDSGLSLTDPKALSYPLQLVLVHMPVYTSTMVETDSVLVWMNYKIHSYQLLLLNSLGFSADAGSKSSISPKYSDFLPQMSALDGIWGGND